MASSLDELDKLLDVAHMTQDIKMIRQLITPDYYHKITKEYISSQEYVEYLIDYFKQYKILSSKTFTNQISKIQNISDKEQTVFCLGDWEWLVVDIYTNQTTHWKGTWSDIRFKSSDGLWRVHSTIGNIN